MIAGKALSLAAMAVALSSAAVAQPVAASAAAPVSVAPATAAANPFSAPIVLRGKLGSETVQMRLQPKVEDADSVEGDYFVFGKGSKILLAGEVSGNAVTMEESEDGIDVSGQWDGKLDGKIWRGTWTSDDGSVSKEFALEIQAATASPKLAKPAKPANAAKSTAAAKSGANAKKSAP
ncbi:hypothetical protein GCM10011396_44840 [Undibacterium terreum]|uniref:Uncharacterized protein n=1 Tax=Undibacterium terreum TaxID=1224302 RepID=A0A916UZ59_9BURK|nr:hypothetical protein GCM10011396_44840 [Undibacterium terreum]